MLLVSLFYCCIVLTSPQFAILFCILQQMCQTSTEHTIHYRAKRNFIFLIGIRIHSNGVRQRRRRPRRRQIRHKSNATLGEILLLCERARGGHTMCMYRLQVNNDHAHEHTHTHTPNGRPCIDVCMAERNVLISFENIARSVINM